MKIKIVLLLFFSLFCTLVYSQTFNSDQNYDIGTGCSDSLDVIIDLSSENFPPLNSQFGIVEICIDIDHNWLNDIDIFLKGPMGITVELTTKNGGDGNNYQGTCFNMNGNSGPIFFGEAPFTGNFIPEGDLNEFNNNNDPNGIWELILCDNQVGFSGTITNWSISFGTPVFTACSSIDSFVLVDFYQHQGGLEWFNAEGWLDSGTSYKDWYGVITDQNGCVTKLNLEANNLNGSIYQNLDLLSELNKIDFQNNELSDSLPSSISNITNLDSLNLSKNINLIGDYPESYLSLCNISFTDFNETMLSDFDEFCNVVSTINPTNNILSIYPNPFFETLNIKSNESIKSIRIYNSSGVLILKLNENIEPALNLKSLEIGVYFLETIDYNGAKGVYKILKI